MYYAKAGQIATWDVNSTGFIHRLMHEGLPIASIFVRQDLIKKKSKEEIDTLPVWQSYSMNPLSYVAKGAGSLVMHSINATPIELDKAKAECESYYGVMVLD